MSDDILSKEEIEEILRESKKDKYSDPRILMFGVKKTSIFRLSRKTGLILVFGNEYIGYNHIIDRHSRTSRIPYWKGGKIGEPSKLPLGIAPIQYLDVAGQIFNAENRKEAKLGSANDFDVYEGIISYKDSKISLRLVTYKGTGIIQTLYPIDKQPKTALRQLRRGFVSEATYSTKNCMQSFEFSYFDERNLERFKVILRCSEYTLRQSWYVQVNDNYGRGSLTTKIKEESVAKTMNLHTRMVILDFSDTTWIEKELKLMMSDNYDY